MISGIHDIDQHAPFAHYMVRLMPETVMTRDRKTGVITPVVRGGLFVICHYCKHWVSRPVLACKCPASCHAAFDITG